MNKPELSVEQARDVVANKPYPKVTQSLIESRIKDIAYLQHGQLTICIITMENGFMVNGQSAPAHPSNYDEQVGKTYAYDNAFKQLWVLEGYLLRQQLYDKAKGD